MTGQWPVLIFTSNTSNIYPDSKFSSEVVSKSQFAYLVCYPYVSICISYFHDEEGILLESLENSLSFNFFAKGLLKHQSEIVLLVTLHFTRINLPVTAAFSKLFDDIKSLTNSISFNAKYMFCCLIDEQKVSVPQIFKKSFSLA